MIHHYFRFIHFNFLFIFFQGPPGGGPPGPGTPIMPSPQGKATKLINNHLAQPSVHTKFAF